MELLPGFAILFLLGIIIELHKNINTIYLNPDILIQHQYFQHFLDNKIMILDNILITVSKPIPITKPKLILILLLLLLAILEPPIAFLILNILPMPIPNNP